MPLELPKIFQAVFPADSAVCIYGHDMANLKLDIDCSTGGGHSATKVNVNHEMWEIMARHMLLLRNHGS